MVVEFGFGGVALSNCGCSLAPIGICWNVLIDMALRLRLAERVVEPLQSALVSGVADWMSDQRWGLSWAPLSWGRKLS